MGVCSSKLPKNSEQKQTTYRISQAQQSQNNGILQELSINNRIIDAPSNTNAIVSKKLQFPKVKRKQRTSNSRLKGLTLPHHVNNPNPNQSSPIVYKITQNDYTVSELIESKEFEGNFDLADTNNDIKDIVNNNTNTNSKNNDIHSQENDQSHVKSIKAQSQLKFVIQDKENQPSNQAQQVKDDMHKLILRAQSEELNSHDQLNNQPEEQVSNNNPSITTSSKQMNNNPLQQSNSRPKKQDEFEQNSSKSNSEQNKSSTNNSSRRRSSSSLINGNQDQEQKNQDSQSLPLNQSMRSKYENGGDNNGNTDEKSQNEDNDEGKVNYYYYTQSSVEDNDQEVKQIEQLGQNEKSVQNQQAFNIQEEQFQGILDVNSAAILKNQEPSLFENEHQIQNKVVQNSTSSLNMIQNKNINNIENQIMIIDEREGGQENLKNSKLTIESPQKFPNYRMESIHNIYPQEQITGSTDSLIVLPHLRPSNSTTKNQIQHNNAKVGEYQEIIEQSLEDINLQTSKELESYVDLYSKHLYLLKKNSKYSYLSLGEHEKDIYQQNSLKQQLGQ